MQWLLACFVLLQPAEVKYSEPVWQMDMVMPGRLEGWAAAYGFDRFYVGTNVSRVWDDGKGKFYVEAGAYSMMPYYFRAAYQYELFFTYRYIGQALLYNFIYLTPYLKFTYDIGMLGKIGIYASWSEDHGFLWGKWWGKEVYTWLNYRYTWCESTLPVTHGPKYRYEGPWFHVLETGVHIYRDWNLYWGVSIRGLWNWRRGYGWEKKWYVFPRVWVAYKFNEHAELQFELMLGMVSRGEDGKPSALTILQAPMLEPLYLPFPGAPPAPDMMFIYRW